MDIADVEEWAGEVDKAMNRIVMKWKEDRIKIARLEAEIERLKLSDTEKERCANWLEQRAAREEGLSQKLIETGFSGSVAVTEAELRASVNKQAAAVLRNEGP